MNYNPKCLPIHYIVCERKAPCVAGYCISSKRHLGCSQTSCFLSFFLYIHVYLFFTILILLQFIYTEITVFNNNNKKKNTAPPPPSAPSPNQFPFNGRQRGRISNASLLPTQEPYGGCENNGFCSLHSRLVLEKPWCFGRTPVFLATLSLSSNTAWRKRFR